MKIYHDYTDFKAQSPVITLGAFDGVHTGHLEILKKVKESAQARHGESVVVTFWPHPRLVLNHDHSLRLLNTLDEKLALLEKAGIGHVVVIPFTESFSQLSPDAFISQILVDKLRVNHLIVGFNHHFGKDREGNYDRILHHAATYGFTVEKLDAKTIENEKISSTRIRKALNEGDILTANKYLGYDYALTGEVVKGDQIGRTIGFPTANVKVADPHKLIPKAAVYAVEVAIAGTLHKGMLNMGFRPTLQSKEPVFSIEVHILDFAEDIYGKEITLLFKKHLRDEIRFQGLPQLKEQLNRDKEAVRHLLGV